MFQSQDYADSLMRSSIGPCVYGRQSNCSHLSTDARMRHTHQGSFAKPSTNQFAQSFYANRKNRSIFNDFVERLHMNNQPHHYNEPPVDESLVCVQQFQPKVLRPKFKHASVDTRLTVRPPHNLLTLSARSKLVKTINN